MKIYFLFLILFITGCNTKDKDASDAATDSVSTEITKADSAPFRNEEPMKMDSSSTLKTSSNERFRNVTVKKTGENEFVIQGQAQIFEANFGWVLEDGHDELQQGHTMTDAGAPAWGNFSFTIAASKKKSNSTLHLILFELSANDGIRQHQLPIPLY